MYSIIIVSTCISGYWFFRIFNLSDLLYFSPLIGIALFYAVRMFNKSLRDIAFIKIILIALSWSSVTVLIPAYVNQSLFDENVWMLFSLNFAYIFALVIPFDVRDLNFDETDKRTIPQLLGVVGSKILAVGLLLFCCVLSTFMLDKGIFLIPVYILSGILIVMVSKKRTELFYAFGIDGLILLFPISTWIVKSYL